MKLLTYSLLSAFLLGTSLTILSNPDNLPPTIDFFTSMGWYKQSNSVYKKQFYFKKKKAGALNLKKLYSYKKLYEGNIVKKKKKNAAFPKIIHQIWVGPKTPPEVFKQSQESIKKYHPDWEYKLWTDKDIPELKLYNQKFYDLINNYGAKSDILRYELLYRYGGIYLDIDFIVLKPLDELCQYDLWSAIQPLDCRGGLCNGVIGSIPGHPILEDCIKSLKASCNKHLKNLKDPTPHIVRAVGPFLFERSFLKFIHNKQMNIMALPASFFFPLDLHQGTGQLMAYKEHSDEIINSLVMPESLAIHCWAGSWWNVTPLEQHMSNLKVPKEEPATESTVSLNH